MGLSYPSKLASLPNAQLLWLDGAGNTIDLSAGYTFVVTVGRQGAASPAIIKTAGITGAPTSPNVTISWGASELAALSEGTWLLQVAATAGGLTRYLTTTLTIGSTGPDSTSASYSGDPSSSPVDEARALIGDTNMSVFNGSAFLTDAEIAYKIASVGSVGQAAGDLCEMIAAKLGMLTSGTKTVGSLTISRQYMDQRQHWLTMAKTCRRQYARLHPGKVAVNPSAMGTEFRAGMYDVFKYDPDEAAIWEVTPDLSDSGEDFESDSS